MPAILWIPPMWGYCWGQEILSFFCHQALAPFQGSAGPADRAAAPRSTATVAHSAAPRKKANYVGAPAIFALEQACGDLCEAFGGFGCYLVGSALERADWRDVDVRCILADSDFAKLFPEAGDHWE